MKRRVVIGSLVVVALAGLALVLFPRAEKEPSFHGIPLTTLLERSVPQSVAPLVYADSNNIRPLLLVDSNNALHQIGSNAIPTLLRLLQTHDSALKLRLVSLAQKQKLIAVHFVPAGHKRDLAVTGFLSLGADASNAVPGLIRILQHNSDRDVRDSAVLAAGAIGKPVAPAAPVILKYLKTRAVDSGNDFTFGFSVLMAIDPEYSTQHAAEFVDILNSPYHR